LNKTAMSTKQLSRAEQLREWQKNKKRTGSSVATSRAQETNKFSKVVVEERASKASCVIRQKENRPQASVTKTQKKTTAAPQVRKFPSKKDQVHSAPKIDQDRKVGTPQRLQNIKERLSNRKTRVISKIKKDTSNAEHSAKLNRKIAKDRLRERAQGLEMAIQAGFDDAATLVSMGEVEEARKVNLNIFPSK
jgi:hypothetical protein